MEDAGGVRLGIQSALVTCVTVTGDWGEGVRNEIIIDVITISRVNLATWINNSELLNWGEAILKSRAGKTDDHCRNV